MNDLISRQAAIDAVEFGITYAKAINKETGEVKELFQASNDELRKAEDRIKQLPSAQPEWNNHTVACLLADMFGDLCACNFNGIDEWLPEKCDFRNTECPHPVGVACWEQFLKYREDK